MDLNLFIEFPQVHTNLAFRVAFGAALRSGFEPDSSVTPVVSCYYDGSPRFVRVIGTFNGLPPSEPVRAVLKLRHDPRERLKNPAELLSHAGEWLERQEAWGIRAPRLLYHAAEFDTRAAWPWVIEEYLGTPMNDYTYTESDRVAFIQGVLQLQEAVRGMMPPRASTPEERTSVGLHVERMRRWTQLSASSGGSRIISEYFKADELSRIHDRVIAWYAQACAQSMYWEHGAVSPRRFVPLPPDEAGRPRWGVLSWEHLAPRPVAYTAAYVIWVCAIMHPDWQSRDGTMLIQDVMRWTDQMVQAGHPLRVTDTHVKRAYWLRIALLERCYGTIMADIGGQRLMCEEEKRARLKSLALLAKWLMRMTD